MVDSIILILVSFVASFGFALVFRITGKDLFLAGLGGALTRLVLILLQTCISERFMVVMLSALFASAYGELLANLTRDPSTFYIYPSMIPLIPGDLFYYCITGAIRGNTTLFSQNALSCILTLLGMSVGFVLSSTIAHYIRKTLFRRRKAAAARRKKGT